jgi:hypothetical protein
VEALTENAPPPVELRMAWMCERWQSLPEAGGVYDQDQQLISRMIVLSNVYNAVTAWRTHGGEKIHYLSEQTRTILRRLQDEGIDFNAMQVNVKGDM